MLKSLSASKQHEQPATATSRRSSSPAVLSRRPLVLDAGFRRQSLDLPSEGQVVRRNSSDVVRAERERQARMPDVDVRVVIHRLGYVRDARDERDARRKARETIRLRQRVAAARPTRQPAKLPLDPDVGETFGQRSCFFWFPHSASTPSRKSPWMDDAPFARDESNPNSDKRQLSGEPDLSAASSKRLTPTDSEAGHQVGRLTSGAPLVRRCRASIAPYLRYKRTMLVAARTYAARVNFEPGTSRHSSSGSS